MSHVSVSYCLSFSGSRKFRISVCRNGGKMAFWWSSVFLGLLKWARVSNQQLSHMCQQETSIHMFSLQVVPWHWVSLFKVWARHENLKVFSLYLWKKYNFTLSNYVNQLILSSKQGFAFTIEGSFKRSQVLLAILLCKLILTVFHHKKTLSAKFESKLSLSSWRK